MSTSSVWRDRVAVITGAGSGLGREFARLAAQEGMQLVLADVQSDALHAVRDELTTQGARVEAQVVDVADAAQVDALADLAWSRFGTTHLLFNNAGVGCAGLIWENSLQDWDWTLGVNLWGVVHGMRAFVPRMLGAARASPDYRATVINTASMAGLLNPPNSGVYNVSKHAVVSLSETLHHDLALVTDRVRCAVLCPYYVPTGIHDSERNRPQRFANDAAPTHSQQVAHAMVEKAVRSGRIDAASVARITFDALREGRFYIHTHPQALDAVRVRADDIVAARTPTDPYAGRPDVRARLMQSLALREAGA